jgi:hypothetical protein
VDFCISDGTDVTKAKKMECIRGILSTATSKGYTTGKWMVRLDMQWGAETVDAIWRKIAIATAEGRYARWIG